MPVFYDPYTALQFRKQRETTGGPALTPQEMESMGYGVTSAQQTTKERQSEFSQSMEERQSEFATQTEMQNKARRAANTAGYVSAGVQAPMAALAGYKVYGLMDKALSSPKPVTTTTPGAGTTATYTGTEATGTGADVATGTGAGATTAATAAGSDYMATAGAMYTAEAGLGGAIESGASGVAVEAGLWETIGAFLAESWPAMFAAAA